MHVCLPIICSLETKSAKICDHIPFGYHACGNLFHTFACLSESIQRLDSYSRINWNIEYHSGVGF